MSETKITIFLIGKVSSGKSSLLNALSGNFISNVSLQRETFNPIKFSFSKEGSAENIIELSNKLEYQHKKNEEKRKNLNKDDTLIEALKLPELYNYDELNIIDFPGLDDSDDKDGHFFNLIKKYINLADMILYVTDASCAFVNSSEIDLIKQLTELILSQQNIHHHYIKFLMVVNKFDLIDDTDLKAIYERIPSKISVSTCDIYRVSSHKLLIDSLIYNKKNMIVPKIMGKEFRKILQTCNVSVNKQLKQTLSEKGIILCDNIEYQNNIDSDILSEDNSDETTGVNYKIIGDWDSLIDRIQGFGEKLSKGKYEMMDTKYNDLLKKYVLSYKESSYRYNYNDKEMGSYNMDARYSSNQPDCLQRYSKAYDMVLLSEFISLWDISHQYYSPKIIEATCEIFENATKLLNTRFYFLEMMIKYCNSNPSFNIYARNSLIKITINNLKLLCIETKIIICYLFVDHPEIDSILYNILIDKKSFNYEKLHIYNEINKILNIKEADNRSNSTWIELIPDSKSLTFVTYMSENIQDKVLKKLLKISMLKREYLIVLSVEKLITEKDFLVMDDYRKFIHWIMTSPNDDILYHRLFDMNLIPNSAIYLSIRNNFIK